MKYKKIGDEKVVDPVASIAESFDQISDKIINQYVYHMSDVNTSILATCVSQNLVFDNLTDVKHVLMRQAKLHVAQQVVGKLSPHLFNTATLIIDYPRWIDQMLMGDQPAFHIAEITIHDADEYLLIDHATWDTFWTEHFSGDDLNKDLEIPDDYLPFDDDDDDSDNDEGDDGSDDEPNVGDLPF